MRLPMLFFQGVGGGRLDPDPCLSCWDFFQHLFYFLFVWVGVCNIPVSVLLGQKKALDPLKLELAKVGVGCPLWVLVSEPGSSGRIVGTFTWWVITSTHWQAQKQKMILYHILVLIMHKDFFSLFYLSYGHPGSMRMILLQSFVLFS